MGRAALRLYDINRWFHRCPPKGTGRMRRNITGKKVGYAPKNSGIYALGSNGRNVAKGGYTDPCMSEDSATVNAERAPEVWRPSGLIQLTGPQTIGTLGGLMLSLLLAALDQTIVGTAMPRIIAELSGFDRYPWVTTSYLLTSTIAVPIFAKLSDIYGRKWFFLTGTVVFVAASAFCGGAGQIPWVPGDGMLQLIVFRGIQGLGAGMIVGLLFTIIGDIFAPAERAKFQGLFAAVWGLASIFGPTLGGWITDEFSWRWTFWVNLPIGALAAGAILIEFPYFRPQGVRRQI